MPAIVAPPPQAFARCDFGPYTVLPHRRLLLRHGEPQRLGDRAFDLLLALLERHGQTVGKDELLDQVWAGRDVEEGNLTVQMCELRRVLGREWLLTCAGRGYGFQGVVQFAAAVPSPDSAAWPAASEPASAAWMFGRHAVLPERRLLLRHGQPLPVGGRAFDLLCLLLDQRHRVVAPSEILDRVWAGSEVGAGNIAAQLTHLRQRLGDACIRTVRHRGYQFTAEVRRA